MTTAPASWLRARRNAAQERAKLALRSVLGRSSLDLVRDPYPRRVARALDHLGVTTVLDVGANIGQFGRALRVHGYRDRIVSFEPLPDAYARLRARTARDPGWEAVNSAVGAERSRAALHVSANSYSSSLLPMTAAHVAAAPGSDVIATVDVTTTTVAAVLAERGLDPARCLLKVDTQGSEAAVLQGAGDRLAGLAAVQLELSFVTLYEGQELADALITRLDRAGLVLFGMDAAFSDPANGRLLQADALFVPHDRLAGLPGSEGFLPAARGCHRRVSPSGAGR